MNRYREITKSVLLTLNFNPVPYLTLLINFPPLFLCLFFKALCLFWPHICSVCLWTPWQQIHPLDSWILLLCKTSLVHSAHINLIWVGYLHRHWEWNLGWEEYLCDESMCYRFWFLFSSWFLPPTGLLGDLGYYFTPLWLNFLPVK